MSETLQEYEQKPVGRPTFLTVLCILTFIGSGWGIIGGAIQYFTASTQAQSMAVVKKQATAERSDDDKGSQLAEKMVSSMSNAFTEDNLKKAGLAAILGAAFCLAGAFMMWNLKKTGFYLYIVGTLVAIVSPFIIYGTNNLISIMSSIGVGFIGLVFIILYGVNVKHMR